MSQLFNLDTATPNPNRLLELGASDNQGLETLEVVAVFGVTFPQPASPKPHQFQLGDIVTQGQQYGVVTSLDETDRPITVTWDGSRDFAPDSFAYTLDELRFFKISVIPQLVPFKTLVELPANITIQLANAQFVKFNRAKVFLVEAVAEHHLIIRSTQERYRFPKDRFPGRLFAYVVNLSTSTQPETASRLSFLELKMRVRVHLALAIPENLELIAPTKKQRLFEELLLLLAGESYEASDLNAAWQEGWQHQLKQLAQDQGFHGVRLGARVLRQPNGIALFGTVVALNIESLRPFQIQWDSGENQDYSLTELRGLGITLIKPIAQLSPNVAYLLSEDGAYFKAWIGFRTKALAQAWWRLIKQQVGYLSPLQDSDSSERRPTEKRYEYSVEKPKQKTLTKRLEALQKVAALNLEQIPMK